MFIKSLTAAAAIAVAGTAYAQDNPMVGGAEMMPDMTIAENASNANNLTTLVAAAAQAGLVETLGSEGPFTVFAPTDDAFGMLSDESLEQLMMDENQDQLAQILTCHVVSTNADSTAIMGMISDDGGEHPVETVGGCTLTAYMEGDTLMLRDENGREASVIQADVTQSNGVVHVIDRVLLPAGQAAN
ncbi:Immunogenic protein MPT70 precursor [Rhodobacteraceae bacterium THAF1]|uniref:fasciclin domain-containing protein n=1 Tax=Palleronia sp. THAF1 TaxID=2587842 RepID=UPI000F3F64C4|nr:fasciclin domain-containing protein [Palleronia sp. THAF1]QFU08190.1 Immunogenic protein MPT70 precursor [Palleronia sp. THAF1]VDC28744.1 Immunogenic protein MPT70 precursor [Rhodobacteraceae bacterium THAF1]